MRQCLLCNTDDRNKCADCFEFVNVWNAAAVVVVVLVLVLVVVAAAEKAACTSGRSESAYRVLPTVRCRRKAKTEARWDCDRGGRNKATSSSSSWQPNNFRACYYFIYLFLFPILWFIP